MPKVKVSPIVEFAENDPLESIPAVTIEGEKPTELLASPTELPIEEYGWLMSKASKLDRMNSTVSISSKYFEFTRQGEKTRGVFVGFSTINKKAEDGEFFGLPVVQWLSQDGGLFCNACVALVRCFESFDIPKGSAFEITYEGKKDRTKLFDVRILG